MDGLHLEEIVPTEIAALLASTLLASVHLFGQRIGRLQGVPRSWALSAGSGVSVAYVFVHLMPELAEVQEHLSEAVSGSWWAFVETHAWIMALGGLLVFYGLELVARRQPHPSTRTGWLHLVSFSLYNAIVGYLLHDRALASFTTLGLFAFAMAVHFLVNDHGLREHLGELYERRGRWLVAGSVVTGSLVGTVAHVSEAVLGLLIAFLAGGVIMNVLKEELPEDRESRWVPLALGAAAYAALLLVL